MLAGIVLAAGAGRRFGPGVKPLARFAGEPLVVRAVAALGQLDVVYVVLGAHGDEVAAALDHAAGVRAPAAETAVGAREAAVAEPTAWAGAAAPRIVRCADWADGQSASLRAGVAAARAAGADGVLVTLCDQPLVGAAAVARVVAARGAADAVRGAYEGVPGHPVLLETPLMDAVGALRGDRGARELLGRAHLVECGDVAAPDDVDTPAALARLVREPRSGTAREAAARRRAQGPRVEC